MVVDQVFDRLEKTSSEMEEFHRRTSESLTAGTENEQLIFGLLRYVVHAAESQTRLLTRGEQIIVQLRLYRLQVLHGCSIEERTPSFSSEKMTDR